MTTKKRAPRHHAFAFTVNNYTDEDIEEVKNLAKTAKHIVMGKEVGKEGTPHLQCHVEFSNATTWSAVRKQLRRASNIEQVHHMEAHQEYCKKDKDFWEFGQPSQQGKRTDLEKVAEMYKKRKTTADDILEAGIGYQAARHLELLERRRPARHMERKVIWLHGPTGTGKTRTAIEAGAAIIHKVGQFWHNYRGQDIVVLDDIRPGSLTRDELLHITDRYAYSLNVKHGTLAWEATTIYITAPIGPEDFWAEMAGRMEDVSQLLRRITEVIKFDAAI